MKGKLSYTALENMEKFWRTCWKKIGISELTLASSNPAPGRLLNARPIYPVSRIRKEMDRQDVLVILASYAHWREMLETLRELDFQNANLCTIPAVFLAIHVNCENRHIPEAERVVLREARRKNDLYAIQTQLDLAFSGLRQTFADDHEILIYSPGKVGSRSIQRSLGNRNCLHLHTLAVPFSMRASEASSLRFQRANRLRRKTKIISAVRSPVQRDLSCFLQNINLAQNAYPNTSCHFNCIFLFYQDYLQTGKSFDSQEFLSGLFDWKNDMLWNCRNYLQRIYRNRSDQFSWFDYEMKAFWNIDVYRHPFDREAGYTIIRQGHTELLVLKLERMDSLEPVIGEFVGVPDFTLRRINEGGKKIYSCLYAELKRRFVPEQAYLDYYFRDNPKVRHFYTDKEIEGFLRPWKGGA